MAEKINGGRNMNDIVKVQDLVVSRVTLGELESNAKEVLAQLKDSLAAYKDKTYSDDEIAEAKKERARLMAMADSVNTERLTYERKWMEPFSGFKGTAGEIITEIKNVVKAIDVSISASEKKAQEKKFADIEAEWAKCASSSLVPLRRVFVPQWLNKTETMAKIRKALAARDFEITSSLHDLDQLEAGTEEAKKVYLDTLSISNAYQKAAEVATILKNNNKKAPAGAEVLPAEDMLVDDKPKYAVPVEPVTGTPILSGPVEATEQEPVLTYTLELTATVSKLRLVRELLDKERISYRKIV